MPLAWVVKKEKEKKTFNINFIQRKWQEYGCHLQSCLLPKSSAERGENEGEKESERDRAREGKREREVEWQ